VPEKNSGAAGRSSPVQVRDARRCARNWCAPEWDQINLVRRQRPLPVAMRAASRVAGGTLVALHEVIFQAALLRSPGLIFSFQTIEEAS
jgi:hypothetical protein